MNVAEQFEAIDSYKARIKSASLRLAKLYSSWGTAPEGLGILDHAEAIEEDHLKTIDEAVYAGSVSWLEAAEVVTDTVEHESIGGTEHE